MRDFNTICTELQKHLRMCYQRQDGEIWWYEGTLELIAELVAAIPKANALKTNADQIRSMSDEELAYLLTADCKYIPEELCRKYLGNCDACLREWLKQDSKTIVKE